MPTMYDSINLAAIPAGAEEILIYTDGDYAETAAEVKARWPNATYHTISAIGQVFAEWIDCEPGAVWPPPTAAAVLRAWQPQGCKGVYASLNNMPAVKEAVNTLMLQNVEYFDADYTGVLHVDPGYVATQDEDPGPYDISDTTPQFEGADPPADPPAPLHQSSGGDMARAAVLQGPSNRFDALCVGLNGHVYYGAGPDYGAFEVCDWVELTPEAVEVGLTGWDSTQTVLTGYCVTAAGVLYTAQCAPATTGWGPWVAQPNAAILPPPASTPGPVGPAWAGGPVTLTGTVTVT